MERKYSYTIRTLLDELKEQLPEFKKGQIFETIKSIYPEYAIDKNKKNIKYNGRILTKPLALSRKDKNILVKENSDLVSFFKDFSRGDFLKVIEINNKKAICENLSLKKEIKEEFYRDKESLILISFEDLANGTVKLFKRRVDKYLEDGGN
jgi:hypothetical protein